MADNEVFREPDEQSGPAFMNREPILFPEQRKNFVNKIRRRME